MGLFDLSREAMTIDALRKLADGCPKHPSYRYRRRPTCKKCIYLFDLAEKLRAYEETRDAALPVYFEQRRKEAHAQYLSDQDRLNTPG